MGFKYSITTVWLHFFFISLLQLDAHAEEMTSDGSVWQTVISGHVFTYSAFIDERPQKPVVKVAAEIYLSKYVTRINTFPQ